MDNYINVSKGKYGGICQASSQLWTQVQQLGKEWAVLVQTSWQQTRMWEAIRVNWVKIWSVYYIGVAVIERYDWSFVDFVIVALYELSSFLSIHSEASVEPSIETECKIDEKDTKLIGKCTQE